MNAPLSRRQLLAAAGAAASMSAFPHTATAAEHESSPEGIRYCLNTSTVRGHELSLVEEIDLAAKAGYTGIEPWVREIVAHQQNGGSLSDLKKRIADAGLQVESAIGFPAWIVDDDAQRAEALEQMQREMDLVRRIGGRRIAAPPSGATKQSDLNLFRAAERYGDLLRLGEQMEVLPQLEVWGFSQSLSRLGEVALVMVESGRRDACLLGDVYHIYKGGSDFAGLRTLDGGAMHVFHMNDYPADPPREEIGDADRVYPGDGVAPLTQILQDLWAVGFRGALSLELFNRSYWEQDPMTVARTGREKMQAAVEAALGDAAKRST